MASKEVVLHEAAFGEAQAVRQPKPSSGRSLRRRLDHATEQIAMFPDAGAAHVLGTRLYVMRRFPFSVVYRERERAIEIVAVAHARRKPGYWKERVKH